MEHPFDIISPACADPVNYMQICRLKCLRPLPFSFLFSRRAVSTIVHPRPGEPIAIHFVCEYDDHRLAKRLGGICPVIDIFVPGASDDGIEIETVWTPVLLVRPVPRRPKNQRQRAMLPNDIQVFAWKILLAPVARRGNDGLM